MSVAKKKKTVSSHADEPMDLSKPANNHSSADSAGSASLFSAKSASQSVAVSSDNQTTIVISSSDEEDAPQPERVTNSYRRNQELLRQIGKEYKEIERLKKEYADVYSDESCGMFISNYQIVKCSNKNVHVLKNMYLKFCPLFFRFIKYTP